LTPSLERAYEQGEISMAEARLYSGQQAVSHMLEAPASTPHLNVVDENHVPEPGVRREATLRKPRKARTWREKMAADQPPESQRVTPLGHDYLPPRAV
jgi:hypothetical protein